MKSFKKLRKILREMEGGIAPGNFVAANGNTIAGASPGEMPPVKITKKRVPYFPTLRRTKPKI